MESIIGIIGIVLLSLIIWAIIFHVSEKYGGFTFISGPNKMKKMNEFRKGNSTSKYLIDEQTNSNPELVRRAQENVRNKKYKMTYQNVQSEIDKIKKDKPNWVEQKEIEHKKNKEIRSKKIDTLLRKKHNIPEFNEDLTKGKNKDFLKLFIKVYCSIQNSKDKKFCEDNFTKEELNILNSDEYISWKKDYQDEMKKESDLYLYNVNFMMDKNLYK